MSAGPLVLGIETSCDETGIGIVRGTTLLANTIASSMDELTVTASELSRGLVPSNPFLLIGQMTTSDPTRSPAGTESAWAYTHVPQDVRDAMTFHPVMSIDEVLDIALEPAREAIA